MNATGTASTTITNTATIGESASTTDSNTGNNSSSWSIFVQAPVIVPCTLSAAQFEADLKNGRIVAGSIATNVTSTGGTATFTLVNKTNCGALISLASYEVFESSTAPTFLSTQQLFDTTSTTVGASSTMTLTVGLPTCEAQVDAYYGAAPSTLLDSNPFRYPDVPFLLGYCAFAGAAACGIPTWSPVANLSIKKTVDNATPTAGATINYTLTVDAQGPATSTGVVATDTLPSGLTFENATASVGTLRQLDRHVDDR